MGIQCDRRSPGAIPTREDEPSTPKISQMNIYANTTKIDPESNPRTTMDVGGVVKKALLDS